MSAAVSLANDDPLNRVMAPAPNETLEQQISRHAAEQLAKRRSEEIDEYLKVEGEKLSAPIVKVLLLGQAESGKSTTLKNMRIIYSTDKFRQERNAWRPIIHFNLLRHVVRIVKMLEEALEDRDSLGTESTDEVGGPLAKLGTAHEVLRMQLRPLQEVEATISKRLSQSVTARVGQEVCVHSNFAWPKYFRSSNNKSSRSSVGDQIRDQTGNVLNGCKDYIVQLWKDPVIHELLKSKKVKLEHEAGFFLDEVERITALDYEPTDLDVCKARLKTVGVSETRFKTKKSVTNRDWVVYDVGGSRTQRESWKPYFDNINAIVFLAPLSAYNQQLDEQPSINRLDDSLLLWKNIVSSPLLARVHLILFLNKIDLLAKKLQEGIEFKTHMTGYTGSNDCEPVCKYMKKKFLAIYKDCHAKLGQGNKAPDRIIRVFLTSVIDIQSTRGVVMEVQDTILGDNLKSSFII